MEIMVCRPDGSERRRVTNLGEANFAPYFFPGDKRIIFASNSHDKAQHGRNFDLFAIDVDGKNVEQVTNYGEFDSFPMFSPDGKWLAFASNRGGRKAHETNLFVAQWRD
jgi:Tol biopolymer transport system component